MACPFETQTARDVSKLCAEIVPPAFSKWVNDMDATAEMVDIHSEEAAWKKPSIYRVTSFARSYNPNAFTPQVISFGPFHHGAENLKATEKHKHRALAHFLHRAKKRTDPFISKLKCILKQLQDSHQMMPLRMPYIKRDMLLLENQLPLIVLKALLEVENLGHTGDQYINNLVLKFCGDDLQAKLEGLACHPLELYRMSMLYSHCKEKIVDSEQGKKCVPKVMENAVELWESGVHFRRKGKKTSLMDIRFHPKSSSLELPDIPVDDGTEYLLLNMVAYEQIHVGAGNEITSYVTFMDALIDTEADVKLLHKKKIISNSLGSHKAVAKLFNNLGKEAVHNPEDALNKVRNQLIEYYEKKPKRWLAILRHEHLHNPWSITGIIVAFLVILFTFLQTLYTALSFHLGKS